jgi:hypothetical protein
MLHKNLLISSLTAALWCLPSIALANNPFLPQAPVVPSPAADSVALPGLPPALPGLPALAPPPLPIPVAAPEERPVGKLNGELIFKDGSRYIFKAEKKAKPVKDITKVKPKKKAKSAVTSKKPETPTARTPALPSLGTTDDGQKIIKVLPNAKPTKPIAASAIPPSPGKPAVTANKPPAASSNLPINAITEKK